MNFIQQPVVANILTSPAVNAGAYIKNEGGASETVDSVMRKRIRYILQRLLKHSTVGWLKHEKTTCGRQGKKGERL